MKERIKLTKFELNNLSFDAVLVSNPVNITYLTGQRVDDGYLLVTASGELIFFTNFLYKLTSRKLLNCKICISDFNTNIFTLITSQVKKLKLKRLCFEAKHMPFLEYATLNKLLTKDDIEFEQATDLIENLRIIKEPSEIVRIKKATAITQEALDYIDQIHTPQMSEQQLSIEVERFLRLRADNEPAFATIVASGKNTVFPHHCCSNEKIENKFFLIDLGAKHYGYCADLTRMFFKGKIPTLFTKIYDTVRKAQELSIQKVRDGVKAADIDKAARDFIERKGYGKYFGHGLGHGIGLSVHEPPYLGPKNTTRLREGMVITIEPAIYFKTLFGARIEDMVLVKKGKGEILSGDSYRRNQAKQCNYL